MGRSRYIRALDGLPARRSFSWAETKLEVINHYYGIFTTGMKNAHEARACIDLMAGSGLCKRDSGREFPGSPLLALSQHDPFTHVVAVEENRDLANALRVRTVGLVPQPLIIEASCNLPSTTEAILEHVPSSALCLGFVDMLGVDVELATLARLSAARRVDWIITFQIHDLVRNWRTEIAPDQQTRFDRFFGTREWRRVVKEWEAAGRPGTLGTLLTDFYVVQLKRRLHYNHISRTPEVMKNSRNGVLYRLLFASKHPRGKEFFDKVTVGGSRGQGSLDL